MIPLFWEVDWRKDGKYLAINGYKGVKIWSTQDWDEEPFILSICTVSTAMAWLGCGRYYIWKYGLDSHCFTMGKS